MEIDAAHAPGDLVEADVVEAFEASSADLPDPVIGDQKVFLPSHENVLPLCPVLVVEIRFLGLRLNGALGWESAPVMMIGFLSCAPILVLGLEGIFRPNEFAFKVGCENVMLVGESLNSQISTKE